MNVHQQLSLFQGYILCNGLVEGILGLFFIPKFLVGLPFSMCTASTLVAAWPWQVMLRRCLVRKSYVSQFCFRECNCSFVEHTWQESIPVGESSCWFVCDCSVVEHTWQAWQEEQLLICLLAFQKWCDQPLCQSSSSSLQMIFHCSMSFQARQVSRK